MEGMDQAEDEDMEGEQDAVDLDNLDIGSKVVSR